MIRLMKLFEVSHFEVQDSSEREEAEEETRKDSKVDGKAVADGDTLTVYVRASDPEEVNLVPSHVLETNRKRKHARALRNYAEANALHQEIIDYGYRVIKFQNEEVLAPKYRIRLRGIDAPESEMPYGKEAREELTKIVEGKSLRMLLYETDCYGHFVGDIYDNNIFVQELMLKKGCAWYYPHYDSREELRKWENEAKVKQVGLWAFSNHEEHGNGERINEMQLTPFHISIIKKLHHLNYK
ncbi:hypothetical protein K1719_023200 [Acacia pycnantha]|nr:hypothetical protein K1719_023200 [Acacia pycnantha]